MAKSLRSKVKLAARRRKAHESHYAVADAQRTLRLSAKLLKKTGTDVEGDEEMVEEKQDGDEEMKEGKCKQDWLGLYDQSPRRSLLLHPASPVVNSGASPRACLRVRR